MNFRINSRPYSKQKKNIQPSNSKRKSASSCRLTCRLQEEKNKHWSNNKRKKMKEILINEKIINHAILAQCRLGYLKNVVFFHSRTMVVLEVSWGRRKKIYMLNMLTRIMCNFSTFINETQTDDSFQKIRCSINILLFFLFAVVNFLLFLCFYNLPEKSARKVIIQGKQEGKKH